MWRVGRISGRVDGPGYASTFSAPPLVHDVLRSPGQPLDRATRAYLEPRSGHDFSRVRIHTDARAAASAQAVNALAYTVGRDVVFGAGQYAPATAQGRRLLAHELAHVAQQGGAAFEPGTALRVAAPGGSLERQVEAAASSNGVAAPFAKGARIPTVVQRAMSEASVGSGSGTPVADDNPCAGWYADRESTTKRAAEHYVRTELQGDRGVVERIECDMSTRTAGSPASPISATGPRFAFTSAPM